MTGRLISSLDAARAANPDLAMALYALTPGGPITLEIITPDEQIFTWTGASEAAVLAEAFPPEETEAEVPASPEPTTTNIFD
jgi:hypothetical protein